MAHGSFLMMGEKGCQIIDIAGRAPGPASTQTLPGPYPSEIVDGGTHSFFLGAEGFDPWIGGCLESLGKRARDRKKEAGIGLAAEDENASLEVTWTMSLRSCSKGNAAGLHSYIDHSPAESSVVGRRLRGDLCH